jgi:hypothetical protein
MNCNRCGVALEDIRYYVKSDDSSTISRDGFIVIKLPDLSELSESISQRVEGVDTLNNTFEEWVSSAYPDGDSPYSSYTSYLEKTVKQRIESADTKEDKEKLEQLLSWVNDIDGDIYWDDIELEQCISFDKIDGSPEDDSDVIGRIPGQVTLDREVYELICKDCKKDSDDIIWKV